MPKRETTWLYSNWVFSFIRNCQAGFQRGSTVLHSYQKCMSGWSRVLHPRQRSEVSQFFTFALLMGVWWCWGFICISLLALDVEHLFVCHLHIFCSEMSVHRCLCTLDAKLLLNMWFANIFSHPVACPFIFLTSLPQSMSWSFHEFQLYHFGEGVGFWHTACVFHHCAPLELEGERALSGAEG